MTAAAEVHSPSKKSPALYLSLIIVSAAGLLLAVRDGFHSTADYRLMKEFRASDALSPKSTEARNLRKVALDESTNPAALSPLLRLRMASFLYDQASQQRRYRDYIKEICGTLDHLQAALTQTPYDPEILINWAALRQDLHATCGVDKPKREAALNAIDLALKQAPNDSRAIYVAALAHLDAGHRTQGQRLLEQFLEREPIITSRQQREIFQWIRTPADLLVMIPPNFQQLIVWSRAVRTAHPFLEQGWSEALSTLQRTTLEGIRPPDEDQFTEREAFDRTLVVLRSMAANTSVRKQIDKLLSTSSAQPRELNSWYARRAGLEDVPAMRAGIFDDQRPLKTQIARWDQNHFFSFDSFYTSVGVFIPEGWRISEIELQGGKTDKPTEPRFIRVYGSMDNQSWSDISTHSTIQAFYSRGAPMISVVPGDTKYRYYKVHFGASLRLNALSGRLRDVVQVYGNHMG